MTDAPNASTSFEQGRYLYCAVSAATEQSLAVDGIEGGSVEVLTQQELGAVVQPVDSLFDSDDMTTIHQWLLSHQRVVDAASESFGTPIPFRFDTIITGGNEEVYNWLSSHAAELTEALDSFAGCGEYRIELEWDEATIREEVTAEDDELVDLTSRINDAGKGTGYLLEKQYEQQLSDRLADRRTALAQTLRERIADQAKAIKTLDTTSTLLEDTHTANSSSDESEQTTESVVTLSVLAVRRNQDAIGDVLSEFASDPALSVTYTGPWPPYSHAPTIGEGDQ